MRRLGWHIHNHAQRSGPAVRRVVVFALRAQTARVKLADPTDLPQFQQSCFDATGYRVPMEYLQWSSVHIVRRGPNVVGGFVINTTPPLRTLARIPDNTASQVRAALAKGPSLREVACVWILP